MASRACATSRRVRRCRSSRSSMGRSTSKTGGRRCCCHAHAQAMHMRMHKPCTCTCTCACTCTCTCRAHAHAHAHACTCHAHATCHMHMPCHAHAHARMVDMAAAGAAAGQARAAVTDGSPPQAARPAKAAQGRARSLHPWQHRPRSPRAAGQAAEPHGEGASSPAR
jgi:hypothetical protein